MKGSINLHPSHLTAVEHILAEHVPECEVRAFGSRATWTAKDYSDLDLAVVGGGPLHWRTLSRLQGAFEESRLPIRVDVLDWHAISERFRKVIERDYVVVQEGVKRRSASTDQQSTVQNVGQVPVRSAMTYAIGGGWGKEHPEPGTAPTRVIRGTDFSNIRDGLLDAVPTRHESVKAINRRRLQPGDIILEISGGSASRNQATGRSLLVTQSILDRLGEPVIPASFCRLVRFDPAMVDQQYVYYSLQEMYRSGRAALYQNQSTGISNFQFNYFLDEEILRLPPLSEQRAIAHVLGTLDDKIELNRGMNETLEEMARALFKSWFVDFEPVQAKMEGRWRRGESLPGLPAEHYDLFPDTLVPSELGEIPEGWEVKPLGAVVELNPREPMKRGTLAPYLDMAALPTSGSSPENAELRGFKSGTRFRSGDTLLARITPCLENGKTAFVQSLAKGKVGWGSTEFIVLRAVPPVPPEYTYLLARDAVFREHAIQSMTGTSGRQRVQVDALTPYLLPYPPAEIWAELRALVSPVFAQVDFNRQESLALAAQRDVLLPGLVSGEVKIRERHSSALLAPFG